MIDLRSFERRPQVMKNQGHCSSWVFQTWIANRRMSMWGMLSSTIQMIESYFLGDSSSGCDMIRSRERLIWKKTAEWFTFGLSSFETHLIYDFMTYVTDWEGDGETCLSVGGQPCRFFDGACIGQVKCSINGLLTEPLVSCQYRACRKWHGSQMCLRRDILRLYSAIFTEDDTSMV